MFIISPVTAQQIAGLKVALAQQGTTVEAITPTTTPGKYSIYGNGLRATALFDVGDSSLVVTITHKPLFAKESHLREELVEELAKIAKASVPPAPVPVAKDPPAPVVEMPPLKVGGLPPIVHVDDPPAVPAGTEPKPAA